MRTFYLFNNRIVSHIVFWLGILFIYTFFPYLHQGHFFEILKTNLFYLPQDIIAVYFVLYVLFPKFLIPFKLFRFFTLSIIAILFLTILSILVSFYILPHYDLNPFSISVREQFSNSFFALFGITGMAATLKYVRLSLINQFRTADISMKQMETELKYLRNQINPHFLFNSLNNIDELVYEDQEKASKAIFLLSEVLRYVLKESETNKVLLNKEIDFIKNYIDFVSFSFKETHFIEFSIEGNHSNHEIPPLLFLPLIENAVKYADRKAKLPGISIKFIFNYPEIEFETRNYFSEIINKQTHSGIGLKNLERRLELIYPNKHSLKINNLNNEFIVNLKISE